MAGRCARRDSEASNNSHLRNAKVRNEMDKATTEMEMPMYEMTLSANWCFLC